MATLQRKARVTGLLYLGLALAGAAGFLTIRPMLFVSGDPAATLANLAGHESLARAAVVLELLVVLTQALAAVWFHRLFASSDGLAIAAFGLVNAVTILVSAALLGAALDDNPNAYLFYLVSDHLWTVGGVFFGLWLIPMGWLVLRSGYMPRPLGWILIAGGVGHLLSVLVAALVADDPGVGYALTVPATIGELWMIGYLLTKGVADQSATGGQPTADRDVALT